jgi:hypothetical protein
MAFGRARLGPGSYIPIALPVGSGLGVVMSLAAGSAGADMISDQTNLVSDGFLT